MALMGRDGLLIQQCAAYILLTCMQKEGEQWHMELLNEYSSYFLCECGAEFEYSTPFSQHVTRCPTHADTLQPFIHPRRTSLLEKIAPFTSIITPSQQDRPQSPKKSMLGSKAVAIKGGATMMWKGFVLSKKENQSCDEPFYCGNCHIIFFKACHFVTHCIEDCQTLRHQRSSHSITHQADLPHTKPTSHQRICEDDFRPFRTLLNQSTDHRDTVPFYCGECQIQIPDCHKYSWHMTKKHCGTISAGSSHVLLQFWRGDRKRNIFLSPSLHWQVQEPIYCCACSPHLKVPMAQLLAHVQQAHHGLSPIYLLPERPKIEGSMQKIREILKKGLDHRKEPFFCGSCNVCYCSRRGYIIHMRTIHQQRIPGGSSHVVLRLIKNTKISNVYLTKKKEWISEEKDYFCPCQPWRKMKMEELISHVQSSHAGFSPLYFISHPKTEQNEPIALSSDSDHNPSQE